MFRVSGWTTATIFRQQNHLSITVPAPEDLGNKVITLLIVAGMVYGFFSLFVSAAFTETNLTRQLLVRAFLLLIVGLPFALTIRNFLERAFASQHVTVDTSKLTWSRRTKLWSRTRHWSLSEISDVVAATPTFGEHGVHIIQRNGSRHKLLQRLSTESAVATARELKQSITH